MEIRIKTADEFRDAHVVIEIRAEEDEDIRVRPLVDERLYTASEVGALQASEAELVSAPLQAALAQRADRIAELKEEIRRMDDQISGQTERAGQLDRRNAQLTEELIRRTHERDEREKARADLEASLTEELARERERRARDLELVERQRDELVGQLDRRNTQLTEELTKLGESLAATRTHANENREWAERAESRLAVYAADLSVAKQKLDEAERMIDSQADRLNRVSGAVHSSALQTAMRMTFESKTVKAMTEAIRQVRDALGPPSLFEDAATDLSVAKRKLDEAQHTIETLSGQLRNISRAVAADRLHIRAAQTTSWQSWSEREAVALVSAIEEVQQRTSPWADSPSRPTSQA